MTAVVTSMSVIVLGQAAVDPLLGLPWTNVGAGGLVVLCILLIMTGRLIPKSTHDEMRSDRDHWRQVAQQAVELAHSLRVAGEVTARVVSSLPPPHDAPASPTTESSEGRG